MRKSKKRDQHAIRAKRAAAKKAKRTRSRKEFEQGTWQTSRRREAAARARRAAQFGDALAIVGLFNSGARR